MTVTPSLNRSGRRVDGEAALGGGRGAVAPQQQEIREQPGPVPAVPGGRLEPPEPVRPAVPDRTPSPRTASLRTVSLLWPARIWPASVRPPAYGQPVPAYGTPTTGAPAFGAPAYGAPAYGAAPYGDVPYGAPVYANPGYGYPRFGGGFTYASWIARVGASFLDSLASLPYSWA